MRTYQYSCFLQLQPTNTLSQATGCATTTVTTIVVPSTIKSFLRQICIIRFFLTKPYIHFQRVYRIIRNMVVAFSALIGSLMLTEQRLVNNGTTKMGKKNKISWSYLLSGCVGCVVVVFALLNGTKTLCLPCFQRNMWRTALLMRTKLGY